MLWNFLYSEKNKAFAGLGSSDINEQTIQSKGNLSFLSPLNLLPSLKKTCWIICEPSWTVLNLLEPLGTYLASLNFLTNLNEPFPPSSTLFNLFQPSSTFFNLLKPIWTFLNPLEPFGTLWNPLKLIEPILLETSWTVLSLFNLLGLSWTFLDLLQPSWNFLNLL